MMETRHQKQHFTPKGWVLLALLCVFQLLLLVPSASRAEDPPPPSPPPQADNGPQVTETPVAPASLDKNGQLVINDRSYTAPGACAGAGASTPECAAEIAGRANKQFSEAECAQMRAAGQSTNGLICTNYPGADLTGPVAPDFGYRDVEFKCFPDRNVWGSCPKEKMPLKRTALKTFKDLSPYLWVSLRDPNVPLKKYKGPAYRGSRGDRREVNSIIDARNNRQNRFASCRHQIEIPSTTVLAPADEAKLVRLQLDNCANQYILNGALKSPDQKSVPKLLTSEQRCLPPTKLTAATACQPLRMLPSVANSNEYLVSTYIEHSWRRLHQDVEHKMPRKRGFGPFTGIIGKIMQILRTVSQVAGMISNLSNLKNLVSLNLPNISGLMNTLKGSFSNIMNTFKNLPGQLKGAVDNLKSVVKNFPKAFDNLKDVAKNISKLPKNFTTQLGSLKDKLGSLPKDLQKNFSKMMDSVKDLPNVMKNFEGLGDKLKDLPNQLGSLSKIGDTLKSIPGLMDSIPNLASTLENLPGTFDKIGSLGGSLTNLPGTLGGLQDGFGNLMNNPAIQNSLGVVTGIPKTITGIGGAAVQDVRNLAGAAGNTIKTAGSIVTGVKNDAGALGDALSAASGNAMRGQFGDINFNAIGNPASQIASDITSLGAISNTIQSVGGIKGAIQESGAFQTALGGIAGAKDAVSGVVSLAKDMSSLNGLAQTLNSPELANIASLQKDLQGAQAALGDIKNLQSMLQNVDVQKMLIAQGMQLPEIQNLVQNFSSLTGTFNVLDLGGIMGVVDQVKGLQGTITGAVTGTINNITGDLMGAAGAFTSLNPMNAVMGELNTMKDAVMGALNIGINLNLNFNPQYPNPEPRLPSGTILKNPIELPKEIPEITLSKMAAFQFEEILDPSHPFAPRYHAYVNDREYMSPMGMSYSKSPTDNVYCAGNATDKKIKVDILEFRREKFEEGKNPLFDGMWQRLFFNDMCYKNMGPMENPCYVIALDVTNPIKPKVYPKGIHCWACFNMKIGSKTENPPCSTRYDQNGANDLGDLMSPSDPNSDRRRMIVLIEPLTRKSYLEGLGVKFKPLEFPISWVYADPMYLTGGIKMMKVGGAPAIPFPTVGVVPGMAVGGGIVDPLCAVGVKCPATCSVLNINAKTTAEQLCEDVRRPYAPMNKLKIRYSKKGDPLDELPSGVPEGLTHKDFFENRMPYPVQWDTGRVVHATTSTQDPMDDSGQYSAIVGVGREAILPPPAPAPGQPAPAPDPNAPQPRKDERCLIGGWGGDNNFGGISVKAPNGVTSWTELKLYQMRTMRTFHQTCIGRYEKLFKIGASEDHVLTLSGGNYQEASNSCRMSPALDRSGQPVPLNLGDYRNEALAAQETFIADRKRLRDTLIARGITNPEAMTVEQFNPLKSNLSSLLGYDPDISWDEVQQLLRSDAANRLIPRNMPNAWRGYVSDTGGAAPSGGGLGGLLGGGGGGADTAFPKFGGGGGNIITGMDNAQVGDIIILRKGSSSNKEGLAKAAYVKSINMGGDCATKSGCFINVLERDFGKWPDICGTTDAWGIESNRNLFKPGTLPASKRTRLEQLNSNGNCEDNDLQDCEFDLWDSVELYRIKEDRRNGVAPSSLFPASPPAPASTNRCKNVSSCAELLSVDDIAGTTRDKNTFTLDPALVECCMRAGWDAPPKWHSDN